MTKTKTKTGKISNKISPSDFTSPWTFAKTTTPIYISR